MKPPRAIISCWPELPPLPPPGRPVLLRVRTSVARPAARQELRTVLRQVLAAWTKLSPPQLPLRETVRGPVWLGKVSGEALDISLSYGKNEGWIALRRAGLVGVDVLPVTRMAEADAVGRDYFGAVESARIRRAPDPTHAFALAWTELEARVKCLKTELTEWSSARVNFLAQCASQHLPVPDGVVVAVATASEAPAN